MKKLLFIAFALAVTVGVSAFGLPKNATEPKKQATYMWFDYTGSATDQNNLDNYQQDPNHQSPCEGVSDLRCEIRAAVIQTGPNAGKPDLSDIVDETFKP